MRLVVVGGGVAGLRAASVLAAGRPDAEVVLLERARRVGGLIETERTGPVEKGGFVIEHGPDAMVTHRPGTLEKLRSLGLATELVTGTDAPRRSYVAIGRELRPLPEGFVSMAPPGVIPILRSPLFSLAGKARMVLEPLMPRGGGGDESVESFVQRRFGKELLDRMVQPLLGGIHATPISRLSMQASLPRLLELERAHGSVALALARGRAAPGLPKPPGTWTPALVSFRRGMGALVDALEPRVPHVRTDAPVTAIARRGTGFELRLGDGSKLEAAGVVVAAPAWAAAPMLEALDRELAASLGAIGHGRMTSVTLAYRRDDVAHPLEGTGFVVPASEQRALLACTWSSRKFPDRAPDDAVLLRAFMASHDEPDDRVLVEAARRELRDLLGIERAPILERVRRVPRGLPRYEVGHLARVDAIETRTAALGAFALAGNAYRGLGIPDCMASGEAAANAVLRAVALQEAPS
jgi:oxygen-dependent protoporphyrinogen oxidase